MKCFREWVAKLSGRHTVIFLVNQDVDDDTRFRLYRSVQAGRRSLSFPPCFELAEKPGAALEFIEGRCRSKIEAVNFGIHSRCFDIILNAADDMWPLVAGYDDVIARAMAEYFPALDGALNFWDGSPRRERLATLSIMGKRLYDFFGYLYNPEYVSLYADNEYMEVCDSLGRMVDVPGFRRGEKVLIQHRHPIYSPGGVRNYDALMRRNESAALYARDKATYERRKAHNFYLPGTGAVLS